MAGDQVEVEVPGVGLLVNPVADEQVVSLFQSDGVITGA
jgi:hypothetical protein